MHSSKVKDFWIIWKFLYNPCKCDSFSRYAFESELQTTSRAEYQRIKQEIENLVSYSVPDTDINIDYQVNLTLLDGHTRVS